MFLDVLKIYKSKSYKKDKNLNENTFGYFNLKLKQCFKIESTVIT